MFVTARLVDADGCGWIAIDGSLCKSLSPQAQAILAQTAGLKASSMEDLAEVRCLSCHFWAGDIYGGLNLYAWCITRQEADPAILTTPCGGFPPSPPPRAHTTLHVQTTIVSQLGRTGWS